ncbi:sensor histidine kinase [Alteromonas facilis]|uniref:sensor histidine kinase n=1 Tax=Alteromonas facilis TaxID=2048004 RepID=UPI0013DB06B8|nr:histidine kinase [Alteromonas facilis]
MRYIYKRLDTSHRYRFLLICFLLTLIISLLWTGAKNAFMWYTLFPAHAVKWETGELPFYAIFFNYSNSFFILLVWTAGYFSIKTHFYMLEQTKRHAAIETDSQRSKFQLLRYQLNPHFLFNSLNAASNLALRGDGEKTSQVLASLASFLRFTLDISTDDKMPLKQDFAVMQKYLEVEKLRFGERLVVNWNVSYDAESCLVPSFLIQPLIENAIKHAVSNKLNPTILNISASVVQQNLQIRLADDGLLTSLQYINDSSGVGVVNIRKRLALYYGDKASLDFEINDPHGLICTIIIPIDDQ